MRDRKGDRAGMVRQLTWGEGKALEEGCVSMAGDDRRLTGSAWIIN